jgi:hypothetical protein
MGLSCLLVYSFLTTKFILLGASIFQNLGLFTADCLSESKYTQEIKTADLDALRLPAGYANKYRLMRIKQIHLNK